MADTSVVHARVGADPHYLVCGRCSRGKLGRITFDLTPERVAGYLASTAPGDYFLYHVEAQFRAFLGWSADADGVWGVCNYSRKRRDKQAHRQKRRGPASSVAERATRTTCLCPDCGKPRPVMVCDCAQYEADTPPTKHTHKPVLKYRVGDASEQDFRLPIPCRIRCDECGQQQEISSALLASTRPPLPQHDEACYLAWRDSVPGHEYKLRRRSYYNEFVYDLATQRAQRECADFVLWQLALPPGAPKAWSDYWDSIIRPQRQHSEPNAVCLRLNREMSAIIPNGSARVHILGIALPPMVDPATALTDHAAETPPIPKGSEHRGQRRAVGPPPML